jgi:hypothetical protein
MTRRTDSRAEGARRARLEGGWARRVTGRDHSVAAQMCNRLLQNFGAKLGSTQCGVGMPDRGPREG